jgi:hypothetical protein
MRFRFWFFVFLFFIIALSTVVFTRGCSRATIIGERRRIVLRAKVVEENSGLPIAGADVIVLEWSPEGEQVTIFRGTTDNLGSTSMAFDAPFFREASLPSFLSYIGRYDFSRFEIKIEHEGYESLENRLTAILGEFPKLNAIQTLRLRK